MKFNNLRIGVRLGFGFGVIILALIGVSTYLILSMNRLSELTTKLYKHPFTVSTAALRIESGIVKMHRSMKDVALAQDVESIVAAAAHVDEYEQAVYTDFDLIAERFLGDKEQIDDARKTFADWKPIRDEVIGLMEANDPVKAAMITKTKGAEHIEGLLKEVQGIIDFAQEKAKTFIADAGNSRKNALWVAVLLLALTAIAMILLAILLTRSISRPLQEAVDFNNRLAKGDLNFEIQVNRKDEVGQLFEAMRNMIANLQATAQMAAQIANGDLIANVKLLSEKDILGQALDTMVNKLRSVTADIQGAATNVSTGSQAMSSGSEEMSNGATEQAAAAEEASSSMEQMAANIRQNADNATQTEKIALKAAADAEVSGRAVAETVTAMHEIVKKTTVIEEIARQTHMLSLNATIEAAKASDYGKGFAVVAAEVRALASRAQSSATEINQLTSESIKVAERAGDLLKQLVPDIQKTAELVQEIGAASREQTTGTEQINRAIQQLDQVIQQNASVSEEMSATAEELASQAEQLEQTVAFFKVDTTGRERPATPTRQGRAPLKVKVAHLNTRAPAPNDAGNDHDHAAPNDAGNGHDHSPAGQQLDMPVQVRLGDHLDAEFERF